MLGAGQQESDHSHVKQQSQVGGIAWSSACNAICLTSVPALRVLAQRRRTTKCGTSATAKRLALSVPFLSASRVMAPDTDHVAAMPKAQHSPGYRLVPNFLRDMRRSAGLTQRQLGAKLRRPQSWVYNCETGNRRVDVSEFLAWCRACSLDPVAAIAELAGKAR